jgi:anthranilate/para-aminobenzoate synthase component II
MRRGVKVLMINIIDSFTNNIVLHIAELGVED